MGKILGGGGGSKAKPAQPYAGAQFQPYSYTNQVGSTTGTKEGAYGFNVASQIDPSLTSLGQTALGYTQPYLESYLGQTTRQLPMFGGVDSGEQRAADIFGQQSALLQPKFAQQRQQLSNDLFGSGRLGLMLSGQTAGAGDVGMVNPDAYGLGLAQSRALAELEQALVNQGLNIEQARSAAQASSANSGAALANAGTKATSGGGGLFSSLLGSAASAFGSPLGTAAASYLFPGTGQAANSLGLTGQSSYADWLAKVT